MQFDARLLDEVVAALSEPPKPKTEVLLEPVGGAVPPGSPFYTERPTDAEFMQAMKAGESIILIKGPRQMGKTSLLARGLQQAREMGCKVVLTDFRSFNAMHRQMPLGVPPT